MIEEKSPRMLNEGTFRMYSKAKWHFSRKIIGTGRALRNEQYSLLAVISELSTVRCHRALGLWIAGTRSSSVD